MLLCQAPRRSFFPLLARESIELGWTLIQVSCFLLLFALSFSSCIEGCCRPFFCKCIVQVGSAKHLRFMERQRITSKDVVILSLKWWLMPPVCFPPNLPSWSCMTNRSNLSLPNAINSYPWLWKKINHQRIIPTICKGYRAPYCLTVWEVEEFCNFSFI